MTSVGSVGRDATLRLFCALDVPIGYARASVAGREASSGSGRPVDAAQLHVTPAFVGKRPVDDLPTVVDALREDRTFVPSDAPAYLSRLHPSGAHYEALARVPLDKLTRGGCVMEEVGA